MADRSLEGWGGKRITRAQWEASIRKRQKEDRAALSGQVKHWTRAEIRKQYTDRYITKLLKDAARTDRRREGTDECPF